MSWESQLWILRREYEEKWLDFIDWKTCDGDNHHSCQIADTIILMFNRTFEYMVSGFETPVLSWICCNHRSTGTLNHYFYKGLSLESSDLHTCNIVCKPHQISLLITFPPWGHGHWKSQTSLSNKWVCLKIEIVLLLLPKQERQQCTMDF